MSFLLLESARHARTELSLTLALQCARARLTFLALVVNLLARRARTGLSPMLDLRHVSVSPHRHAQTGHCARKDRTVTLVAALPAHYVHSRTRQPPALVPHHQQTAALESAPLLAGAWLLATSLAPTTARRGTLFATLKGSTCRGVRWVCERQ